MNSNTIPDAIEKLLDTKFESCETPGSRWLEKRSENGSLLRIILNSEAGSLDFSYGFPMAPGQECEIRFHLESATVVAFGDSLRLVEQSGFTVHLVHQEGGSPFSPGFLRTGEPKSSKSVSRVSSA